MPKGFIRTCAVLLAFMMSSGCALRMVAPESPESSMAIIEPILSGKMRVGLNWQSYVYKETPSMVQVGPKQNRLICADLRNTKTGETFSSRGFLAASQCYYPNLKAGSYSLMDYPLVNPDETYTVLLVKMHNKLEFDSKKIEFTIGSGEVKHVGKYVIHMKGNGSKLKVERIEKLKADSSVGRARQELARAKSAWVLK